MLDKCFVVALQSKPLIVVSNELIHCEKLSWMHGTVIIQRDFREFEHYDSAWEICCLWDFDSCFTVYNIYKVVQTLIKMIV